MTLKQIGTTRQAQAVIMQDKLFIGRISPKENSLWLTSGILIGIIDYEGCRCAKGVVLKDSIKGYFKFRMFDHKQYGIENKFCFGFVMDSEKYTEECYLDSVDGYFTKFFILL